MKMQAIAAVLVLAAAGCASPPSAPPQSTVGALGTPFFIAFKIPVCAVTVALSAPLAGAAGLSPSPSAWAIRADLDDSIRQNCGPPYVLTP